MLKNLIMIGWMVRKNGWGELIMNKENAPVVTEAQKREVKLALFANNTANELLKYKLTKEELSLFLKRLQIVDMSIK